jgi:hypothetical protein
MSLPEAPSTFHCGGVDVISELTRNEQERRIRDLADKVAGRPDIPRYVSPSKYPTPKWLVSVLKFDITGTSRRKLAARRSYLLDSSDDKWKSITIAEIFNHYSADRLYYTHPGVELACNKCIGYRYLATVGSRPSPNNVPPHWVNVGGLAVALQCRGCKLLKSLTADYIIIGYPGPH